MPRSILAIALLAVCAIAAGFGQATDSLTISPQGNVGVGTRTPTAKLEVVGELKVQGPLSANLPVVPASGNTYAVLKNLLDSLVPIGSIQAFGGTQAPVGWFLCEGQWVSKTSYPDLFAVIGYNFGKNNANLDLFQLPDLRGQFLRGVAGTTGTDPDLAGRTVNGNGATNAPGSRQADMFMLHAHLAPTTNGVSGGGFETASGNNGYDYGAQAAPTTLSGGNETRPKNVYVNFIIKS